MELIFRSSFYGRVGHFIMLVAAAIMAMACVLPFASPQRLPAIPLLVLVGMVVFGAGRLALALYCAWFAFGPAARFRLTKGSLRYRGLFGANEQVRVRLVAEVRSW